MSFNFDQFLTKVKESANITEEELAEAQKNDEIAAQTDATDDADIEGFYMGIDREPAKVTCDVLNVRETPSTDKPRIGQLHRGASICVIGVCDDWLEIDLQGNKCYVCGKYTDFEAPSASVTASSLNVRKGPSTDDDKIGSLPNGASVKIIGEVNGWAKILHNSKIGYVSMEYLNKD